MLAAANDHGEPMQLAVAVVLIVWSLFAVVVAAVCAKHLAAAVWQLVTRR